MVKEIKDIGLWFILSMITVLFAIGSASNEGLIKYIYFFVALISCYGIRLFAKRESGNIARK